MTQSAVADGMDPERTMNTESNLMHGSGSRNVKRTSPLSPIRRRESVLLEEFGSVDRHELAPLGL